MLLLDQSDKITAIDMSLLPDAILQWLIIGISILMMIAIFGCGKSAYLYHKTKTFWKNDHG